MAIPTSNEQGKEGEMEKMRKRNEELQRELRESYLREQYMRRQLEIALDRVRVAEEAEELLCTQLADLEVDALEQSREFHARIASLMEQLAHATLLLHSSSSM